MEPDIFFVKSALSFLRPQETLTELKTAMEYPKRRSFTVFGEDAFLFP